MKRLLTLALALMMALSLLALCASCTAETTDTPEENSPEATPSAPVSSPEEQSKPAALPEGYTLYDNGDISFAYPEAFTKTDGSNVILTDTTNNNNITVVYEAKTNAYEDLTTEKYNEVYIPVYAEMGLTVTNATVAHKEHNGIKLTTITQTTKTESVSMDQTQYVLTVGEKTYTVTVTEVVKNAELVSTVLETLTVLK
ncbi:MAG: hypothetical protein IJZ37_05910 [Clostridia bacterium]|nr:hypothetical protein [Clostridia bacterium]MBQ8398431.1 hypothetical protein [Clostridia bacterium]